MLCRLLRISNVFRIGAFVAIALCISALTSSTSGFLVAATNLPDLSTLHVLSRALDLDPGPGELVTLVLINDADYAKLGAPMPMQKRYLAKLIGKLRPMAPKAILVDFDISLPTNSNDMASLDNLLSGWEDSDPLLMFPRELTPAPSSFDEVKAVPSAFDAYFSGSRPVFWMSTVFQNSENELLDEWSLWTTPKDSCEALLSPQLLLHLFPKQGGAEETRNASACLARRTDGAMCTAVSQCDDSSAVNYSALDSRRNTPVHFVLGDNLKQGPSQDFVSLNGRSSPAFYVWSSGDLLNRGLDPASIHDRVVIIGGAYAKANDRHDTPIGRMDGARVLANAISTGDRSLEAGKLSPVIVGGIIAMLSIIALVGFLLLKPIFFGLLYFAAMLAVYVIAVHTADISTSALIVRGTIGFTAISIGLESIITFFQDLSRGRGWRSVLNEA